MSTTRNKVVNQRVSLIGGVAVAILLFCVFRLPGVFPNKEPRSFFFGSMAHWPGWVQGFWPLDLALGAASFVGLMLLLTNLREPSFEEENKFRLVLYCTRIIFLLGAEFGAAIVSVLSGWFNGLEAGLIMGTGFTVVCAVIALFCALLFGLYVLAKNFWEHNGQLIRAVPGVRLVIRFGNYLNAKDIPED